MSQVGSERGMRVLTIRNEKRRGLRGGMEVRGGRRGGLAEETSRKLRPMEGLLVVPRLLGDITR